MVYSALTAENAGAAVANEEVAAEHSIFDTNTKSALSEVVALTGTQESKSEAAAPNPVEEAPIVKLTNTILQSAIKEQASDIHIEPVSGCTVRFRIDGILHEVMQMPGYIRGPLTRRLKVLAGVDIIEYRVPQQGTVSTRYAGKEYNLRVNILPTISGERMVIRISDAATPRQGLDQLGFTPEMQTQVETLMEHRHGMLLLAGTQGQGKTTTQYVLLDKFARAGAGVYAVADYYDYWLRSISQAKLNPAVGYTADAALRSILELDADVVALDKCRSQEALRIALEMAAGSAFVLHTQHAPNSIVALRQLLAEMAENLELVAEGVCGILAQTLVRRICSNCKEHYEVTAQDLRRFGYEQIHPQTPVLIARGKGCEVCRNTGYKGRLALFELITMNADIAAAIAHKVPQAQLEQAIRRTHPLTMREDGLAKILQGVTTPQEVVRAVPIRG